MKKELERAEEEKRVFRTQLRKTMRAYKDPSIVAPKLRDSIEENIAEQYALNQAKYMLKLKEMEERLQQREKEMQEKTLGVIRRQKKGGNPKIRVEPPPKKRKIVLE